jgi:IstB-like ATP binding protein
MTPACRWTSESPSRSCSSTDCRFSKISYLTRDDITRHDGQTRLRHHGHQILLPPWLAILIGQLALQPAPDTILTHLPGPVGVGKSHIAQALGHLAIRAGADVRFTKTSRTLADLAGGHADRSWDRRLREYTRPAALILDDFAVRKLTAARADDLYELISERAAAGHSLILTSNRSPVKAHLFA